MTKASGLSYFISAGEFSGDLLAADLVLSLKKILPDSAPFGLVGEAMWRAGVREVASISSFSVMGVIDVALRLGELKKEEAYILSKIDELKPAFAILVDFPGLHFRLAEQLKLRGIPVYQYCAPKVWAWNEKRASLLVRDFAMVLGILPFEEQFFLDRGVNYQYIGSPHIDRVDAIHVKKSDFGFAEAQKIIGLLPGSRVSELKLIFPRLLKIKKIIHDKHPDYVFVMPLAPSLSIDDLAGVVGPLREVSPGLYDAGGILVFQGMSLELMAISDVAIVASGTATLECGLLGTPMVVTYIMDSTTFEIAKSKVKVQWASLVNLIMNREMVKEFLQVFEDRDVAAEICSLAENGAKRESALADLRRMREGLSGHASANAAEEIVKDLRSKRVIFGR